MKLDRMFINQPSPLQPFHAMHGTNVLATRYTDNTALVYLLDGDTVSMVVSKLALSNGWVKKSPGSGSA